MPPALRPRAEQLLAAIARPALHARRLAFDHPFTGEPLGFASALPADLGAVVGLLGRLPGSPEIG